MKQVINKQKGWLVRIHQKINDGMVDKDPKLEWLRSKFGISTTMLLLAVLASNWCVIYGVAADEMPSWLVQVAQWVLALVPGAEPNVQHSWHLRESFPYIYTVNFIFSVLIFLVTVVMTTYKQDQPFIKITGIRDMIIFHSRYLVMLGLFTYFFLIFYCGFGLEPAFEAKPLPQTTASGSSLTYRMFETSFGALSMYSLLYGWGMPLFLGLCIHIVFRWYLSAFKEFYIFLSRKEF